MRPLTKITGISAAAAWREKIGPDLRFQNDDQGGLNGAERALDRKRPVERKIDDRIGESHAFARQRLTRDGGGGNDQAAVGIGFFQSAGERDAGENFSHRNRMQQDGTLEIGQPVSASGYEKPSRSPRLERYFPWRNPCTSQYGASAMAATPRSRL